MKLFLPSNLFLKKVHGTTKILTQFFMLKNFLENMVVKEELNKQVLIQ